MKYFLPIIFFVFANLCFYSLSAEESLTVKQQLDRIKQEVSDLNKAVFNKSFDSNDLNLKNNQDDTERFTSIDIRMYDFEKDIKNLTLQFEEIMFKLDDISNYIQKLENEMNLNAIKTLKHNFNIPVGLSDHFPGIEISLMSLGLGANIIERHFTLDKTFEGPDHILSSEPEEMKKLVDIYPSFTIYS